MIKAEDIKGTKYSKIPDRTIETINNYVEYKLTPGSFVEAVLCNNLIGSFSRADIYNRAALFEIVTYLSNEVPFECWGSREKYNNWLNEKEE